MTSMLLSGSGKLLPTAKGTRSTASPSMSQQIDLNVKRVKLANQSTRGFSYTRDIKGLIVASHPPIA